MAFSTNGTSGGAGLSSEINVTPLIDVLLVMLIIFMVIVPVMPRGLNSASMPVRLPEPIVSDWSLLELMSSRSRRNVDTLSDVLSDAMESARRCPPAALICRDLN